MEENTIIALLDTLRGQWKDSAAVLICSRGDELTIASAGVGSALTSSVSFKEDTRTARNALVTVLMQMLLARQSDNDHSQCH